MVSCRNPIMHQVMEHRLPVAMDRYVDLPLVLYSYSIAFEQFNLQVILFGLKLVICPFGDRQVGKIKTAIILPPSHTILTLRTLTSPNYSSSYSKSPTDVRCEWNTPGRIIAILTKTTMQFDHGYIVT